MTEEDKDSGENAWKSRQASVDRLRVENWLKIAQVVRWSPLLFASLSVRVFLGLASGVCCAVWLKKESWGTTCWLAGAIVFTAVVILLLVARRSVSRSIEKLASEIGAVADGHITGREAMIFAQEAFEYCHRRGSVPAGATLKDCRRNPWGKGRFFRRADLIWYFAVIVQALVLASFGLGGILSKFGIFGISPVAQRTSPFKLIDERKHTALESPLNEMPVPVSPNENVALSTQTPRNSAIPHRQSYAPAEIEREIKTRTRNLIDLENAGDLDRLLDMYGRTVDYFGVRTENSTLRSEKEADFKKWVKRNYQMASEPVVTSTRGGKWEVKFMQVFERETAAGEVSSGKIASTLIFENIDGQLRITGQLGPVSDRKVVAKAGPSPTPVIKEPELVSEGPVVTESEPPVVEKVQEPRPRIVHKVPELKNLVNRAMDNDWLYGTFCLTGWRNNVALCRTYGRGILLRGEGPTSLQIEFSDGLYLGPRVLREVRNGRLVTFRISEADPMQLVSIVKDRAGNLRVRARMAAQLTERDLSY